MSYTSFGNSSFNAGSSAYASPNGSMPDTENMMMQMELRLLQQLEQQEEQSEDSSDSDSDSGDSLFSQPEEPSTPSSGMSTPGASTPCAQPKGATQGGAPAGASSTGATSTQGGQGAGSSSGSSSSGGLDAKTQQIIDGKNNYMPTDSDKAPPGLSAAQIGTLNNGLLDQLGNQNLQGQGNMADLLAKKCGGTDANSLKTDPNVAWKAYMTLNAIKNSTGDGKSSVDPGQAGDGKINGFSSSGDAYHGTEAGQLQDYLLHGTPTDGPSNAPKAGVTASQQQTIDGCSTSLPSADEKAPPGYSVDDIKKMDNNLLGNCGNQSLQGQGGMLDLLAKKCGGTDANSINTDPDVAWRVYKTLVAFKNEKESNGSEVGTGVSQDGKVDGFTNSGDACRGSNAGDIQDYLLHGRLPSSLQTGGDHVHADGTEKSGGEIFWDKAGKYILMAVGGVALLATGVGAAAVLGAAGVAGGAAAAGAAAGEAATAAGEAGAVAGEAGAAAGEAGAAAGEAGAAAGEAGAASGEAAGTAAGEAAGTAADASDGAAAAAEQAVENASTSSAEAGGESAGTASGEATGESSGEAAGEAGSQAGSWTSRVMNQVNDLKSQIQSQIERYSDDFTGSATQDLKSQFQGTIDRLQRYLDDPKEALTQDAKEQINNLKEKLTNYMNNPTQAAKEDLQSQLSPSNIAMKGAEHADDLTGNGNQNNQSSGFQGNGWGYSG